MTREPIHRNCLSCRRFYLYMKEEVLNKMTIEEIKAHYDSRNISISLAYCHDCHHELREQENYTKLLHQLGNRTEEQRQKFKHIPKAQRIRWLYFDRLPDDICLNCGIKTETRATRASFSFCSEQCRKESSEQSTVCVEEDNDDCDT
jgi:hypothetical protein